MPGTLCSCWLACPQGKGQAGMPSTDGRRESRARPAEMDVVSRDAQALAVGGGAALHPHQQPEGTGLSRQGAGGSKGCLLGPTGKGAGAGVHWLVL